MSPIHNASQNPAIDLASLPLRYRFAQLSGDETVPRPAIADHPRTQACARLIDQGAETLPFHGFDSLESILKVFGEHGIDRDVYQFKAAFERVEALDENSPQLSRGLGKSGKRLDDYRCGGGMLIRAAILARAGLDDEIIIAKEITESVALFTGLLGVANKDELVMPYRDKFIMHKGIALPSYYHLVILAHTQGWRTPENLAHLKQAVSNLCRLSLPHALVKCGSQLVAPAYLNEQHWLTPWKIHYDSEKAMWVERTILLLQASIADEKFLSVIKDFAPKFVEQWSKSIRNTQPFLKWGAYSGIGLEPDWKSGERKKVDLWFRQRQIECLLPIENQPCFSPV
ncbi:MAG: hypothetical protein JW908_03080 [Anaerolineales bacterium]|nr:hypothetical protein [Anaerolineales bacterium]